MFATRLLSLFICLGPVIGCQSLGVEPWERGTLAKADMQFQSRDLRLTTDDHFYFSKEGTSGGGCGCN